jgi:hypothetical protein
MRVRGMNVDILRPGEPIGAEQGHPNATEREQHENEHATRECTSHRGFLSTTVRALARPTG